MGQKTTFDQLVGAARDCLRIVALSAFAALRSMTSSHVAGVGTASLATALF
jgi:hypothetical protein